MEKKKKNTARQRGSEPGRNYVTLRVEGVVRCKCRIFTAEMEFKTLEIAVEHILNWLIVYIKRYNYCNVLIHFSVALRLPVELDLSLHCALNKAVTQPSAVENAVGERSARYLKLRSHRDRQLSFPRLMKQAHATGRKHLRHTS